MSLGHRLTASVVSDWFLVTAASLWAAVGVVLRTSQNMPDQNNTGKPGGRRISAQDLMHKEWPINERFAAALDQIRRDCVPTPSPDAPSVRATAKTSADLQR